VHKTEYTRDAYATVLGDIRALVDKASPSFFILSVESGARINWAVAGEAAITVGPETHQGLSSGPVHLA
jgi:hypothetical protein